MIKLGIVMDPIANINIKKDSSFAMLLEAQRRGYELHYMEMGDLYLINGEARAHTRTLNVKQNYEEWFSFVGEQDLPLADLDVILMRKDPPFDTEFIYATYILERAEEKGTLIVNKPQSLRDCNEKLFTAWFSDLTPETLVTRNKGVFPLVCLAAVYVCGWSISGAGQCFRGQRLHRHLCCQQLQYPASGVVSRGGYLGRA